MPAFPAWLDTTCTVTLIAGALCAVAVFIDVLRRPQTMAVMNIVWPVCALFGILLTLWLYWRFGRSAAKGAQHSARASGTPAHKVPFAVQVATAALHCGSGCTLGDILAEWLAFLFPAVAIAFGWHSLFDEKTYPVWILDFLVAFILGVAFQYLAITPMRKLTPAQGIVAALKADALSLLAWQIGMYCLMAILQFVLFKHRFGGLAPVDSVEFWAAMQLAMIGGFVSSYPMNWWLIRYGLKESM
jgi:hypothetical protein